MKKVLCYIALVFLIVLIITPPLVRVLYKDKDDETIEVKDKFELLICNKGNFTISTSYKNNEPLNIKFEHLKDEPSLIEEDEGYKLEYYLYNGLKNLSYAKEEERVNGNDTLISYYIVYTDSSDNDLMYLKEYRYPVREQKNIYEKIGYTCNIMG